MSNCVCGGCNCGSALNINLVADKAEEIQYESHNNNSMNNLWKIPTIYPNTDGQINE